MESEEKIETSTVVEVPSKRDLKPHRPTAQSRRMVTAMLKKGLTNEEICEILGVAFMTLERRYAKEMAPFAEARNGRPEHVPTELNRRVISVMAVWAKREKIAEALDISTSTLTRYYDRELKIAAHMANNEVVKSWFKAAKNGNVGAIVWWTKQFMGMKEPSVEIGNANGKPFQIEDNTTIDTVLRGLASAAARIRAGQNSGEVEPITIIGPEVQLEFQRPPGTEAPAGGLDLLPSPGRARLGESAQPRNSVTDANILDNDGPSESRRSGS